MLVHRGDQELDSLAPESAGVHPDGLSDLEEGAEERKHGQFLSRSSLRDSVQPFDSVHSPVENPFVTVRLTKGYTVFVLSATYLHGPNLTLEELTPDFSTVDESRQL